VLEVGTRTAPEASRVVPGTSGPSPYGPLLSGMVPPREELQYFSDTAAVPTGTRSATGMDQHDGWAMSTVRAGRVVAITFTDIISAT